MTTANVTPAGPLRAFVEELVAAGVRDAIVCPGSRSTPMALALRANPDVRVLMHVDERAAAFFALGLAKTARRPVTLLATSGTAVVNFAPAVAEAHEGRVPLVVLTADRPPELRDRGANQTIDQAHLYGRFAKWFAELPVPDSAEPWTEPHARWVAARAVATAIEAPAGPVQVDLPFREPLVPDGSLAPTGDPPHTRVVPAGLRLPAPEAIAALAERLAAAERPLLVCGPLDEPGFADAVARLAAALEAPILADALANVRLGPHDRSRVIARHDALARVPAVRERLAPDLVVRFGATPTSKALLTFLGATRAEQVVVDDGGWNEPTLLPGTLVHAHPAALAEALAAAVGGAPRDRAWLGAWHAADAAADGAIREALAAIDEPFEGAVFAALTHALPDGAVVYVGNSMPVRDLDAFLPASDARLRLLGNRGVSGIDGVVSSALGAASAGEGPVVAIVGDLSFVHDLNALVAARLHSLDATIVVIDNDGGGIFSFLPQATADAPDAGLPEHYEEVFGTPHGVNVLSVARALGATTIALEPRHLVRLIGDAAGRPGIRVLRLTTERRRNVELHRLVTAAVTVAVEAAVPVTLGAPLAEAAP